MLNIMWYKFSYKGAIYNKMTNEPRLVLIIDAHQMRNPNGTKFDTNTVHVQL